ncbi:hypothetical protein G7Y89_g5295 [Cudoniella acicularis]|uniref:T6SS Phospholipase effector Tle1-like catalytic domain-containing protein n=1 Tax=Cudoniella acicularis TaxID=354080 RepID=A0A8H4W3I4_9HELO|nr:hypothetical protein G7Y89_g5295 [Cudoniella acicularis]
MASTEAPRRAIGKKLVIACDGTWEDSDQGYEKSTFAPPTAQIPTNVTRIIRALNHQDDNKVPQIGFYQRGIGTNGGTEDELLGGLTGSGLSEHVREAYGFLANNFDPQTQAELDNNEAQLNEIVLLGFSRGAFTARAIASLISDIGLLTHIGMEYFWGIFGDWMKQNIAGRESEWFASEFGDKIPFTAPEYRQRLIDSGYTRWPITIRAVGVWDTVGSLGIPISFKENNVKAYSFVNTKVAQQIQHAFHAVALDEHRNLFSPTLWEEPSPPTKLKTLKQCWFPGVHSNIGGSYADAGISNITLAWMISQLEDTDGGILKFDPDYLDWLQDQNAKYYIQQKEVRPWGLGQLYDSASASTPTGFLEGLKPITRTPGHYNEVSDENGKQTKTPLKGTNECIHSCVRVRIDDHGDGPVNSSFTTEIESLLQRAKGLVGIAPATGYKSAALANYELVQPLSVKTETDHARVGPSGVFWKDKKGNVNIPEDTLGRTELRLLKRSVAMSGAATVGSR